MPQPDRFYADGSLGFILSNGGYIATTDPAYPNPGDPHIAQTFLGHSVGTVSFKMRIAKKSGLSFGDGVGLAPLGAIPPHGSSLSDVIGIYCMTYASGHAYWLNDGVNPGATIGTPGGVLCSNVQVFANLTSGKFYARPIYDAPDGSSGLWWNDDATISPGGDGGFDMGALKGQTLYPTGMAFNGSIYVNQFIIPFTPPVPQLVCLTWDKHRVWPRR